MTSAFGHFPFQSKQRKENLLGSYKNPEIETSNFHTQPNLDNLENDTLNIQTPPNQNNPNPEVIN
ncbi:hypothetical protein G9A89_019066 [Geosiphon pyriformis]|nr:hypothetical protein G9A89_019066 [Geosiphon pyriformis]